MEHSIIKSLPNELMYLLFSYLSLTAIRIFGRTCSELNEIIKYLIPKIEIKYFGKYFDKHNIYSAEKFTFELCHDNLYDMIPEHYMIKSNSMLVKGPAFFNNISFLEIIKQIDDFRHLLSMYVVRSAIKNDQIDVLEWALENYYLDNDFDDNDGDIYTLCAKFNSVKVFKWAIMKGFKHNTIKEGLVDISIPCSTAVKYGNLEILTCFHENNFTWNYKTCLKAAKYGKFNCLKYLHENDCEWIFEACLIAAKNGHLDCVIYIYENGCHLHCLKEVYGITYLNENEFYPTIIPTTSEIEKTIYITDIMERYNAEYRYLFKQEKALLDAQEKILTSDETKYIHNKLLCYNYICGKNEYICERLLNAIEEARAKL